MHNTYTSPLISVIIPSYNNADYLPECIESVLNQTYGNVECIIVNDGSTDHTEEVVDQYVIRDQRVRYYSQSNKGVSAARNLGIEKARGKLITFLDSDDWLNKKLYETQIQYVRDHNLIDENFVVYSDYKIVWESKNGEISKEKVNRGGKLNKQELKKKMLGIERDGFPPLCFNCCLMNISLFKDIRFSEQLGAYEDLACWYKILVSDAKFMYAPIIGMFYRRHGNNSTADKKRMRTGYLMCLEEIFRLNREDLVYVQDMDEILRYFSINRNPEMLQKAKVILRNSPIPVYTRASNDIKRGVMVLDRIGILNVLMYQLFIFDKIYKIYWNKRIRIGKIYRKFLNE